MIKVIKVYQEQSYDPSAFITLALECSAQFKLFHWKTSSFAQHQAFDMIGKETAKLFDRLVETLLGRYGNCPHVPVTLQLVPYSGENILQKINQYLDVLTGKNGSILNPQDKDVQNIVEEIVASVNKLKYLLTLE